MRVTILGSGASSGTPAVNSGWGLCDPAEPRNRRLRPSILVEQAGARVLVDTSPDLRQQLLDAGVDRLDAVLYTHHHADHLHGIDDLRPVNRAMNAPLDVYADEGTLAAIRQRFGYVFEPLADAAAGYYKPMLVPHEIRAGEGFGAGPIAVVPFEQDHGFGKTMGFRFGPVAYSTDLVELPEAAFAAIEGIRVWIIGTLVDHPHPTHADVDKALAWVARVRPRRAVLTHLSGRLDYRRLRDRLPAGVEPAYDGMVIEAAADASPDP